MNYLFWNILWIQFYINEHFETWNMIGVSPAYFLDTECHNKIILKTKSVVLFKK